MSYAAQVMAALSSSASMQRSGNSGSTAPRQQRVVTTVMALLVLMMTATNVVSALPCSGSGNVVATQPLDIDSCTILTGYNSVTLFGSGWTDATLALPLLTSTGPGTELSVFQTLVTVLDGSVAFPGWTSVGGNFAVAANDQLRRIINLPFTSTTAGGGGNSGSVNVWNNPRLTDVSGFSGVTAIGGNLDMRDNYVLSDLSGFDNLVSVNFNGLQSLWLSGLGLVDTPPTMFGALTTTGSVMIQGMSNLTRLQGFASLTHIGVANVAGGTGGGFTLGDLLAPAAYNPKLQVVGPSFMPLLVNVSGTWVGASVVVAGNPALRALALPALQYVPSVWVKSTNLTTLDLSTLVACNLEVYDNANLRTVTVTQLAAPVTNAGRLRFENNPNLRAVNGLTLYNSLGGASTLAITFKDLSSLNTLPCFGSLIGPIGTIIFQNTNITVFNGTEVLPRLILAQGSTGVTISYNSNLTRIVNHMPGSFFVNLIAVGNPRLTAIDAPLMASYLTLSALTLQDNPQLTTAFAECCSINALTAKITVTNNAKLVRVLCTDGANPMTAMSTTQSIEVSGASRLCCATLRRYFSFITFTNGAALSIGYPCTSACTTADCLCQPPAFVTGTMRMVGYGNMSGVATPIMMNQTSIGQQVTATVYSPTDAFAFLQFAFGTNAQPNVSSVIAAQLLNPTTFPQFNNTYLVLLTLGGAVGTNMHLSVKATYTSVYRPMVDSFSYPPPQILNGTSFLRGSFLLPRAYVNVAAASAVNVMVFDARNVGPDPRLVVTYGPASNPTLYACAVSLADTTASQVVCQLAQAPAQQGVGLVFRVNAASQTSTGTDVVNFLGATVTNVTGCPEVGCPTAGGGRVVVYGTGFVTPITVQMGPSYCLPPIVLLSSTAVECTLPAGTGQQLGVVVNTDSVLSAPASVLTYAAPQLFGVAGCKTATPPNVLTTVDCARSGAVLTLTGTDFGPSHAVVYIGSVLCIPSVQNNTYIECVSGPGNAQQAAVSVIQYTGVGTQSTAAFASFVPCSPGTFNPLPPRQYACDACSEGTFSSVAGVSTCAQCAPGRYANTTSMAQCTECPLGRAVATSGVTACAQCQPGEMQDTTGKVSCTLCRPGRWSSVQGAPDCQMCPAGQYQPANGMTSCMDCPVGTYSDGAQGVGAASCTQCPLGTMGPRTGLSACFTCPQSSTSSFARNLCNCAAGYFGTTADEHMTCATCPTGAQCDQVGLNVQQLVASNGWWRDPSLNESALFLPCLQLAHCQDGHCGDNREGPICALCQPGYTQAASSTDCVTCPSHNASLGGTIGFTLLLVLALCVVFYGVWRSSEAQLRSARRRRAEAAKAEADVAAAAAASAAQAAAEAERNVVQHGGSSGEAQAASAAAAAAASRARRLVAEQTHAIKVVRAYTSEHRAPLNYTYQLKMLLSYVQLATAMLGLVELPWPSYFQSFIGYFAFVNLDFIPWTSVACLTEIDFYVRMAVVIIIPVVVIVILVTIPRCVFAIQDRLDFSDSSLDRHTRRKNLKKFRKLVVFALFLMYPAVSSRVLSFFICRSIDGTHYLVADFTLRCYDATWYKWLPLAIAGVLLYPIGIPALMFGLLYRNRARLRKPDILISYGLLYEAYAQDFWFFELVDMVEKLVLTSLLGFLPPRAQCPVGMAVTVAMLCILLLCSPYLRQADDRMASVVQIHLFLILSIGYTLQTFDFAAGSLVDILASLVMFAVLAVLLGVMGFHAIVYGRKKLRARQRDARWKAMRERVGMPANAGSAPSSGDASPRKSGMASSSGGNGSGTGGDDLSLSGASAYNSGTYGSGMSGGASPLSGPRASDVGNLSPGMSPLRGPMPMTPGGLHPKGVAFNFMHRQASDSFLLGPTAMDEAAASSPVKGSKDPKLPGPALYQLRGVSDSHSSVPSGNMMAGGAATGAGGGGVFGQLRPVAHGAGAGPRGAGGVHRESSTADTAATHTRSGRVDSVDSTSGLAAALVRNVSDSISAAGPPSMSSLALGPAHGGNVMGGASASESMSGAGVSGLELMPVMVGGDAAGGSGALDSARSQSRGADGGCDVTGAAAGAASSGSPNDGAGGGDDGSARASPMFDERAAAPPPPPPSAN